LQQGEFDTGRSVHIKHHVIMEDGAQKVFHISASPIKDANNTVARVLCIAKDITEQEIARNEIIKAKKEWESTFDAMSDIVTLMDKDMRIIRANKSAHRFFKVQPGELNGRY